MANKVTSNGQPIDISVNGDDFLFTVTRDAYNTYVNAVMPNNKIAPAHNFLVATVDAANKDNLLTLLNTTPGAETTICQAVIAEYCPDLAIVAKKRSA